MVGESIHVDPILVVAVNGRRRIMDTRPRGLSLLLCPSSISFPSLHSSFPTSPCRIQCGIGVLIPVFVLTQAGHMTLSPYPWVCHVIGWTLHCFVLVPYYGWRYSHALHRKSSPLSKLHSRLDS